MKMQTELLSGAGNTFHIISEESLAGKILDVATRKKLAKAICLKIPADGFIFLRKAQANYLQWMFYNNDGSDAEMCGNATRCVGYYAKNIMKDKSTEWHLQTTAGNICIQAISETSFQVQMTPIIELSSKQGFYCNTGVPHLVIPIERIGDYKNLMQQSRDLRNDSEFGMHGTNVTYLEKLSSPSLVKAVSYERGVENFTQACGTGAMAAAFYNFKKHGVIETNVEMLGGSLIMNLANLQKPIMTGPATSLGSYTYEI